MLKPLLKKPNGFIGFIAVSFYMIIGFMGPLVVPTPRTDVKAILAPPSYEHPLGTDNKGKDILVLLIRGGREILSVALVTGLMTTVISVTLGSLAAYLGGALDRVINFVANFLLTIPHLILLAVLALLIRLDNPLVLALLLSIISWPSLMRAVRSQVLSLRERDYVEAAVALDLGTWHIILYEILPNMASYIIINLIFGMTSAIYAYGGLLFLGFVPINVTQPNWVVIISGALTSGAINNQDTALWLLAPIMTIALLQWSLITLARSIEDVFNPRLRSS